MPGGLYTRVCNLTNDRMKPTFASTADGCSHFCAGLQFERRVRSAVPAIAPVHGRGWVIGRAVIA